MLNELRWLRIQREARVTERHACAFGDRRFGYVVMDYRGRVVSLLLTANAAASDRTEFHDAAAHIERTSVNGFSVLSVPASDHMILLVSDLSQEELGALAQVVAIPLARQLEPGSMARVFDKLAVLSPPSVTLLVSGPCMRPEL